MGSNQYPNTIVSKRYHSFQIFFSEEKGQIPTVGSSKIKSRISGAIAAQRRFIPPE